VSSKESLRRRVIKFLRARPGATPREIADALGVSLNLIRAVLMRLREEGIVVRGDKGYYARVAPTKYDVGTEEIFEEGKISAGKVTTSVPHEYIEEVNNLKSMVSNLAKELDDLKNQVKEIREAVSAFEGVISKLRKSLNELESSVRALKYDVNSLKKLMESVKRKEVVRKEEGGEVLDKFILKIKEEGVMSVNDALKLLDKPIDYYVNSGKVVVISSLVVDAEFFDNFVSKFPLNISELGKLSSKERMLLEEMVRAGYAYLYGGKEYRVIK